MSATIWVRPIGQPWEPIGRAGDYWHDDLVAVSDGWGPKTATFTLKRQRRGLFPDLLARTPVAIDVGGVRVWRGRIKNTPDQKAGAARQINVECVGGQAILDDDQLERALVHTDLGAWKDTRAMLGAGLTRHVQGAQVAAQNGLIQLGWAKGTALPGSDNRAGVTLDLGPGQTAKRIVVEWESSNNAAAFSLYARANGTPDTFDASGGPDAIVLAMNVGASGTSPGTFTTAHRYVHLFVYYAGAATTASDDFWFRIKAARVFADAAYESGNASILSARTGIVDTLTRATTGLHPDWTGIGDPAFAFPGFAPGQPRTPRELIAAFNAPHAWRFKIDEQLRPIYKARPTVPVIDLGAWLGAEGDTGSSNNDEEIVTKVTVRGTGPDGTPVRSTGTQTGTVVDRHGTVAARTLDTSYKLNQTLADKLRDTYLATHRTSPFKGQNVVAADGARLTSTGHLVDPAHLLLLTGELARHTDLTNPDTGGVGRTATISQVTYRDRQRLAELDMDSTRRDFEALQERLGLLVPA